MINAMYIGANIIHLTNALMYMWAWYHEGFRGKMFLILLIPECFNVCEASLYISSSSYYNSENYNTTTIEYYPGYNASYLGSNDSGIYLAYPPDPITTDVQNIEMTASLVAMVAAFGWSFTWYLTYRRIPGRGWTLDDPDVWALFTLIAGDAMYIVYNSEIIYDRSTYGANFLYVAADWVFVVNSWLYVICALRDADWFFLLPTAGRMNFHKKYALTKEKDNSLKDVV